MMKTPITIAVLALHLAIITTILAQQGCNSTEDASNINPDLASQTGEAKTQVIAPKPQFPEGSNELRADPTRPATPTHSVNKENETPTLASEEVDPKKELPEIEKVIQEENISPILAPDPATVQPKVYIVQKGDNLTKIAAKNGVSLNALMAQNNLDRKSVLKIGQKLEIPSDNTQAPQEEKPEVKAQATASTDADVYVVQKGDSLSKIAVMHKTSIRAIMEANGMKKTGVRIGQKLKIPTPIQNATKALSNKYKGKQIHTIEKGEYLGAIAQKYNISVTELMDKNSITDPRKIQIGQVLIIRNIATEKKEVETEVKKETPVVEQKVEGKAETKAETTSTSEVKTDAQKPTTSVSEEKKIQDLVEEQTSSAPENSPSIQDL